MISTIIFIFILAILILIHEFGHFIVAKLNGVRVDEFGFGLPPRIFGIKKGETLYSINLIPFGGFVKLFGEEYHEISQKSKVKSQNQVRLSKKLQEKAFIYKKPWQKTLIILAGVIMNFLLGTTIYYYLLSTNNFQSEPLPTFFNYQFKFGTQEKRVIILNVNKNSPAEKTGIKHQDIVLAYKKDSNWQKIKSSSEFINLIKNNKDKPIQLDIINNQNGERKIVTIVPYFEKKVNRYIIGVSLTDSIVLNYQKPYEKIFSGFFHSYNIIDYNLKTIVFLISSSIKEKDPKTITQSLSGPVGIYSVVQSTIETSGKKVVNNLLNIIALLSLSLALMNVLPFPALDGGRMIFVLYEWITGKPSNKEIEKYVNLVGFLILISFALVITYSDIVKFFK